jgi:hypothetical protein
MARLTTKQRNKLPASAFVYPSKRSYPVPTAAQAKAAGISPSQMLTMHRAALSYSARGDTMGSYPVVAKAVKRRSGGKVTPGRNPGNGGRGK